MKHVLIFFLSTFALFSCTSEAQPASQSEVVTVYATSAANLWLTELYACGADSGVVLKLNADSPDIFLRVGEPEMITSPVYQIDEVEILVAAHRDNNSQNLTLAEVQDLFAQGTLLAQVWVYPSEADMQRVFDQFVMQGRSVSSSAKIAVSVQNMSEVLKSDPAAIGILPRQSVTGDLREVFSAGRVPVLAVTKEEPQGMVGKLISCLQ
jgi:hypothetical protein